MNSTVKPSINIENLQAILWKKIWFSSSRFRNCIAPFTISYSICFICNNKEKQETILEMHLYLEGLVN